MTRLILLLATCTLPVLLSAQNLGEGLILNDLSLRPMQPIAKPAYLDTIVDPSFGTTIRRISDAGPGNLIVPMYSTIQAWNADESLMILLNQTLDRHLLLDGMTYEVVRMLNDVRPADVEQIFWDFDDPDVFYYPDRNTRDFIRYTVSTEAKETIVNLLDVSGCTGTAEMGNDIQMMSWDSDLFTWRCNNDTGYSYRITTGELTTFTIASLNFTAPAAAPSGDLYYHLTKVYAADGAELRDLNENGGEHSCLGKMANGNDAYFAISFAQGPDGGCLGDIIAHDMTTGEWIPIISQAQGYDYSQSGTHISALAHKNTQPGWLAASMIGYDQDGQALLDQELVIARADRDNVEVYRIGHHRSDEDQFDYYGEPHAVISPTGTRVLFGSDWSGPEDGGSVDSYVVELPAFAADGALPAELLSFTGQVSGKQNSLQWTTAAEHQVDYYLLQRSKNGTSNWEEVGRVRADNHRESERAYSLTDREPLSLAHYGLSTYDLDGAVQRSNIIRLQRGDLLAASMTVSPNPAGAFTLIEVSDLRDGEGAIRVYNVNGDEVARGVVAGGRYRLDTGELAAGLYSVWVVDGLGNGVVGKFVRR